MTAMDADALAGIAAELITRVRDDEPRAVHRYLLAAMSDASLADWVGLCMVQAAATPDDRPWSDLVAWIAGGPDTAAEERAARRREQNRACMQRARARAREAAA